MACSGVPVVEPSPPPHATAAAALEARDSNMKEPLRLAILLLLAGSLGHAFATRVPAPNPQKPQSERASWLKLSQTRDSDASLIRSSY
jgi:hypothetical protein